MYDLLTEPLLPAVVGGRLQGSILPGVLAQLSGSDIDDFPGLAAHQRQAWFHFLVQVASLGCARAGRTELPTTEAEWAILLAALTPGQADTAWSLIVPEASRAALLQPPTRKIAEMKPAAYAPDAIDVLLTAKNHDVKGARVGAPEPHHWLYALLTLQTMQGYSGRGNFGIARMNGGFGSRVLVELTPSMAWGDRFRRGVRVALAQRQKIFDGTDFEGMFDENGLALLWLEPWDAETSLGFDRLDPCFVEICRRIRLMALPDGGAVALFRPSDVERVAGRQSKGVLGDPFTPVSREGAALTVSDKGFNYRLVADLLTDEKFRLPASLARRDDDPAGDMLLHLAVLVRGQGKTEGLHDRVLPVSPRIRAMLRREDGRRELNTWAREMIETIKNGPKRALQAGVLALLQAPAIGEKIDFRTHDADAWLDQLDRLIDAFFFTWLSRIAAANEAGRDVVKRDWQSKLEHSATQLFDEAQKLVPSPSARREQAHAIAEIAFRGILRKNLPMLTKTDERDAA